MIYQCFFNLHNCTFNNRYMHQPNLARCLTTMTYLLGDDDIITTRSSDKHGFITTCISPIASKFTIVDQHRLTLTLQVIILSRRLGQLINRYGIISTCISVIITKQDSISAYTGRTLQAAMVSPILQTWQYCRPTYTCISRKLKLPLWDHVWPSGLKRCDQNRKLLGSNPTRRLAGLRDPTLLRGSR